MSNELIYILFGCYYFLGKKSPIEITLNLRFLDFSEFFKGIFWKSAVYNAQS